MLKHDIFSRMRLLFLGLIVIACVMVIGSSNAFAKPVLEEPTDVYALEGCYKFYPLILENIVCGPYENNCYLLYNEKTLDALIIDCPAEGEKAIRRARELKLNVHYIFITHGHIDHVMRIDMFRAAFPQALVVMHSKDAEMLKEVPDTAHWFGVCMYTAPKADQFVDDWKEISLGEHKLGIRHVPGHSLGSIDLVWPGGVASGDTLFYRSIGRTDFENGDFMMLINAIKEQLFTLPDETLVFPGHGPSTTIGDEKANNKFFKPEVIEKILKRMKAKG